MIRIGMVGSGFAAKLHLDSYRRIGVQDTAVTAICSKDADLGQVAEQYGIPRTYGDLELLLGDPSKARETLGWEAKTTLEEMISEMVDADIARHKKA